MTQQLIVHFLLRFFSILCIKIFFSCYLDSPKVVEEEHTKGSKYDTDLHDPFIPLAIPSLESIISTTKDSTN